MSVNRDDPLAPTSRLRQYPNFNFIRLLAATGVMFSHAFLIADGTEAGEPLVRLLGPGNIIGIYCVFVFFIASGYLITQSAVLSSSVFSYAWKRALRIYPALFACGLVTAGVIAPWFSSLSMSAYFGKLIPLRYAVKTTLYALWGWQIESVTFYAFPQSLGEGANGALWTIPEELACYGLIGVLLFTGLLRFRTAALLAALAAGSMLIDFAGAPRLISAFFLLLPSFAFGSLIYFIHRAVGLRSDIALAMIALALVTASVGLLKQAFPVLVSYPLIWLATSGRVRLPSLEKLGDISYGVYLYGWPVEQVARAVLGPQATWWAVFAISWPVAAILGYASWHLLEKRALRLKKVRWPRRPTTVPNRQ